MSTRDESSPPEAYVALVAESQRIGLPHHFETDLTLHDRSAIAAAPEQPFFWGAYTYGTHMSRVSDPRDVSAPLLAALRQEREFALYWWDGIALLDYSRALARATKGA